jgi:hypothetical protein
MKGTERKLQLTNSVLHANQSKLYRKKRLLSLVSTQGSPMRFSVALKSKMHDFDALSTDRDDITESDGDISEINNELIIHQTIEAVKNLETLTLSKLEYYEKFDRRRSHSKEGNNSNSNYDITAASVAGEDVETKTLEEIRKLDELYNSWDNVIRMYESEELPGYLTFSNVEVEDWYTLRAALTTQVERLYSN